MKILFLILVLFFPFFSYADSDFQNDYTLIDCENWDNLSWSPFDSKKPYETLWYGIRKTLEYINSNINLPWNEQTASWKTLQIKVVCSEIWPWEERISIDFDWERYNNELVISWLNQDSLVFYNVYVEIPKAKWNIKIENARFLDNSKYGYYFALKETSSLPTTIMPYSSWVKIENSYIVLKPWTQFWNNLKYFYYNEYNYNNQQNIYNSIIDVELNSNLSFSLPYFIKDSQINFINSLSDSSYNILFTEDFNSWEQPLNRFSYHDFNYSTLISNEINLWWNNLLPVNDDNIFFINNKFSNFSDIVFNSNYYVNNLFENSWALDLSNSQNAYNNLFSWDFINNNSNNDKKNFSIDESWASWLSRAFTRYNWSSYLDYSTDIFSLYKEITWQDIPTENNPIVLFIN